MRTVIILMMLSASAHAGPVSERLQTLSGKEVQIAQSFTCARKTCGRMRSCAEACHALLVCGDTARDGDNDGIPCETLCSRRC